MQILLEFAKPRATDTRDQRATNVDTHGLSSWCRQNSLRKTGLMELMCATNGTFTIRPQRAAKKRMCMHWSSCLIPRVENAATVAVPQNLLLPNATLIFDFTDSLFICIWSHQSTWGQNCRQLNACKSTLLPNEPDFAVHSASYCSLPRATTRFLLPSHYSPLGLYIRQS